jgi:hypothetical protein
MGSPRFSTERNIRWTHHIREAMFPDCAALSWLGCKWERPDSRLGTALRSRSRLDAKIPACTLHRLVLVRLHMRTPRFTTTTLEKYRSHASHSRSNVSRLHNIRLVRWHMGMPTVGARLPIVRLEPKRWICPVRRQSQLVAHQ